MFDNSVKCFSKFNGRHYDDVFTDVEVYYEHDFFLACHSYNVMVPVKSSRTSELNIFEITILKLLDINYYNDKDLANKIGTEEDFVTFIVASLMEREFLTNERKLTDNARSLLNLEQEGNTSFETKAIRVFALKDSKRLLPLICFDDASLKLGRLNRENRILEFLSGSSAGTERRLTYKYYSFSKDKSNLYKPNNEEVLQALKNYNRLCENNSAGKTLDFSGNHFSVEYVEDVFVHMKAILQRNHLDVKIISDGFVANNSQIVEYFENIEDIDFFARVYESANKYVKEIDDGKRNIIPKYKEIVKYLRAAEPQRGEAVIEGREHAQAQNQKTIRCLFAAMEWTLHYYLKNNPLPDSSKMVMLGQTHEENTKLALGALKKIGFAVPKNINKDCLILFSQASGEKIAKYDNDPQPNLDLLLAPCLVEASKNVFSPWHELVKSFPNLIGLGYRSHQPSIRKEQKIVSNLETIKIESEPETDVDPETKKKLEQEDALRREKQLIDNVYFSIFALREHAKSIRHDSDNAINTSYIKAQGWVNKVTKIIRTLLPDYDNPDIGQQDNDIVTQKIKDIVSLKPFFSQLDLAKFPKGVRREIYSISPARDNSILFSTGEMVVSISKIMEAYFKELIYLQDISVVQRKEKSKALAYIKARLEGRDVPVYLRTVGSQYYQSAVMGRKATLGAYVLAWAGHNDIDIYTGEKLESILLLLGQITGLRMHGNQIDLEISKDELLEIRNKAFELIKEMEQ